MCGVTLGARIHFRRAAYDPRRAEGIELLGHELAHVRQFHEGMRLRACLWAARRGHRRNAYEIEARAVAARIRAEVCGRGVAPEIASAR